MKQTPPQSRHNILWAVILCYLFPFIGLSSFGALVANAQKNWTLLSIGLLLSATGSLALYWLMVRWEAAWNSAAPSPATLSENKLELESPTEIKECPPPAPQSETSNELLAAEQALQETKQANAHLQSDMAALLEELQKLSKEKELSQQRMQHALNDLEACKQSITQQQDQHKAYIHELQNQLGEQKNLVEKKQYRISHLETKVGDLTYEIKTLLQIAERHLEPTTSTPSQQDIIPGGASETSKGYADSDGLDIYPEKQIRSSEEASTQLKRCLDIAQKITGSNRFNAQISPFMDSPADSFTLDLRRLCDTLRSENNSIIILYSPKENQPLFVNNHIRESTGWSPDKFVQNFNDIINDSLPDWRQGLTHLALKPETAIPLSLKTKSGPSVRLQAQVGLIPTGIFRHHAIAILYPVQ